MMRSGALFRARGARWAATLALCGLLLASATAGLLVADSAGAQEERPVSSWDEYAERVDEAYALALELGVDVASYREAHELAAGVNRLLPVTELVDVEGAVIEVDNSVLRSEVARLDAADDARRRRRAAEAITGHLASLARSVDERRALDVPSDPEALEELLAGERSDLQQRLQEMIAEFAERILRWLNDLFQVGDPEQATVIARFVTTALLVGLGLLFAWIVVRLVRYFMARRREGAPETKVSHDAEPIVAAAEGLPDDALGHADTLAARGDLREAVRALFGGAARALVEEGVVRQTRTLTNAELLREVRPVSEQASAPLAALSGTFESAWYGHQDPGRPGYDDARGRYVEVVAAAEAAGLRRAGDAS
jgi:hypothetical protein